MSVTVRIPTILRTYADGASELTVDPATQTVAGVIDALDAKAPGIGARILDDGGSLRRFVNVYVDGDDIRHADGTATPLHDGCEVHVIPSVAGG